MAVTFALTRVSQSKWGNRKRYVYSVSATGTTTAGGDVITFPHLPGTTSQPRIEEVHFQGQPTDGTVAYPASYDHTTGKVQFWETGAAINTGLAVKGAGESMTTTTFRVTVIST